MSRLNRTQKQLHHTSSSSIKIAEGFPNIKEGNEGDITIRHIRNRGVYIFVKYKNQWYSRQLFTGKSRTTGVMEAQLENPSSNQQLNFYDSQSGQYYPVDISDVFTVSFASPGNLALKLGASGATAVNQVNNSTTLDDTDLFYHAVEGSTVESGNTLTINQDVDFSIVAADPSLEEEERINKRLRFDAEVAYSLGNIHTKFDWIKEEIANMNRKYYNRLVAHLSEKNLELISEEEKESLTQPERGRPLIGASWSFDFEGNASGDDIWTCLDASGSATAHGLQNQDRILFTKWGATPLEYNGYIGYQVQYVNANSIRLYLATGGVSIIEGTADSSGVWEMTYASDPDGVLGGLQYSSEYGGGSFNNYQPDLVEGETYTTGGVCSVNGYATENSCVRAGGTWYPPETI